MQNRLRDNFTKVTNLMILSMPMSFLFHYIEISLTKNGFLFACLGTLLFIIVAGVTTRKRDVSFILVINFLSILLSVILAKVLIIPPNESWFNPFGINFAISFTGFILLNGILIIRILVNNAPY